MRYSLHPICSIVFYYYCVRPDQRKKLCRNGGRLVLALIPWGEMKKYQTENRVFGCLHSLEIITILNPNPWLQMVYNNSIRFEARHMHIELKKWINSVQDHLNIFFCFFFTLQSCSGSAGPFFGYIALFKKNFIKCWF